MSKTQPFSLRYREKLSASEAAIAIVLSFAFAGLVLASNHVGLTQVGPIPYGNDSGCDNWWYFGHMLNPRSGNYLMPPDDRSLGRVTYFAPVYMMHRAVPQINVSAIAYYLYFPISLCSLYIALRALFSRGIAILASMLVGFSPLLLIMNYQTHPAQGSFAYSCCMLAALLWGGRMADHQSWRSPVLFSLAGLFFVFSLNAHLVAIMFNSSYCLLAFTKEDIAPLDLRRLARAAGRVVAPFIFGAAVGGVLIAGISHFLELNMEGTFYSQFRALSILLGNWQYPGWMTETLAFGLMALASLLCIFAVFHNRNAPRSYQWSLIVVASSVILTCILNLIDTFLLNDQPLVYDNFYFLLLPAVALAFCSAFNADSITVGRATFRFAASIAVVAALSINVYLALNPWVRQWLLDHTQAIFHIAIVMLFCALLVVSRNRRLLVFATLSFSLCLQVAIGKNSSNAATYALSEARSISDTAQNALTFLFEHLSENPVIWVGGSGNKEAKLPVVRALMRCVFNPSFPDQLPDKDFNFNQPTVTVGKTLVLVATSATSPAEIDEALRKFGFSLEVEMERFFPMQGVPGASGLQVTIGKVGIHRGASDD